MVYRAYRRASILVLAACIFWGILAAHARAASATSLFPGDALARSSPAAIVYSQPPDPGGGILPSALRDPDGSATDQWAWDGFRLARTQAITEVRWRGAYDPAGLGGGGLVFDFTVDLFASIPGDTQPDIAHPPLAHYEIGGNADEMPADLLGGVQTYDYRFILPAPFQASAGTKYWVQVEAHQSGPPDWGLSAGTSGDGQYFRRIPGQGANYQLVGGDAAFTLLAPRSQGYRFYLPMIWNGGGG